MCIDADPEDLSPSRTRWFDLPAKLFFHSPVRCRGCGRRYYAMRRSETFGPLKSLWMHYALLYTILCLAVGWSFYEGVITKDHLATFVKSVQRNR